MQSNSTSASILEGDGIYCERQTGTIDIETLPLSLSVAQQTVQTTTIVGRETKTDPNHNEILRLDGKLTEHKQEKLDNRQLPEIDGILNALDEQVQVLEELKRRIRSPSCSEKSFAQSKFNTQQDPFQFPLTKTSLNLRKNKSTATKSVNSQASDSSSAPLTRQFLLDSYIKSSIEEDEHECGCRYHLALERRLDLLDDLDECYRRFSQSQSASSSPTREASQESDDRLSLREEQQQVSATAGPTRAADPRAAAVASGCAEHFDIERAAPISEADRRPCARFDNAVALATSTSARKSPLGGSSKHKVKRGKRRLNIDDAEFSGAQDREQPATLASPPQQQASLAAKGLFIDSGSVHSFTANSSQRRRRAETGAANYYSERRRDRQYSSKRQSTWSLSECDLHRAVREWQANCQAADESSSYCVSPRLSAPDSFVGLSGNLRSFSDNDSRAPKTSCNCCCHHQSTATLSSSGGSCCSSDQFEVRSALDCVEESPPNNNSSNNNCHHQQDRNPISLSGGQRKREPQLDCSLTNDSAASLQESPSFAHTGPGSSVYSQDEADFDRLVRGVVECASSISISSEGGEGPVRQLSVSPPGKSMKSAEENNANKSIGFCNKSKTQRPHLSSTNDPNGDKVDGELRDHKRQDTARGSGCPQEAAPRSEQLDNDGLGQDAKSEVPKSHNLAPERRGLKRVKHPSHSSSCSFDSATNVTASNSIERQERLSMRAAKDIVKLSVPSLSALQYLPGQIESKPAQLAGETSKRQRIAHDKKGVPTTKMQRQTKQMIDRGKSILTLPSQEVGEVSEEPRATTSPSEADASSAEAVERDGGPCLLHRLCLCNCMARNHSNVKKPRSDDAAPTATAAPSEPSIHSKSASRQLRRLRSTSSSESAKDGASHKLDSLVSSHKEVAAEQGREQLGDITREILNEELDGVRKDLEGARGPRSARARPAAGARQEHEKQSPKFLGLLAQASEGATVAPAVEPTQVQQDERDRSGARGPPKQRQSAGKAGGHPPKANTTKTPLRCENHDKLLAARTALVGSDGLGSIGDLATASGRSSSASGSHTNSDLVSSFLSQCNTKSSKSSSFNSKSGQRSADILTESASCKRARTISSPSATSSPEPASQCPRQKQSQRHPNQPHHNQHHQKRKVSGYRKLLSPSKLFSSTSASSTCEHCQQEETEQHLRGKTSFLSRSLGRLSGRKSTCDRQRTLSANQQQSGEETTRSSCVSPTLSVSNNSQTDTNFSDSINDSSIDELSSNPKSLPCEVNRELFIHHHQQEPTANKSLTRLLKAPEIVLSEVEYQDVDGNSHTSDKMARSTSGAGVQHRNTQIRRSARNKDNSFFERSATQRHGSEISFASSSPDSDSLAYGPFSLPGSPRSWRRRRNPSRSPRLSHSPVPFHSPAIESTKIEDGLKVCSTEHFEKHIGNIKDNQIEAQKRLFTAWINHFAPNLIRHDLFVELQDGIKLIGLLAALTHDRRLLTEHGQLTRDRQSYINRLVLSPQSRLKHLHTVNRAIEYMRKNLGMKLVGLNAMDIVDARANVILGLCWCIILNFQLDQDLLKNSDSSSQNSGSYCASQLSFGSLTEDQRSSDRTRSAFKLCDRRKLPTLEDEYSPKDLATARGKLLAHINKRFNLRLTNLTSSLIDGDVMMAIIKQLLPADIKLDESRLATWSSLRNDDVAKLEFCFELASDYLNVPRLISASDLMKRTIGANDTKPLLVYLSMLLKSNPRQCSTDQMLELRQLGESLEETPTQRRQSTFTARPTATSGGAITEPKEPQSARDGILAALNDIDTEDKFHVDKLQATLAKVEQLDQMRRKQTTSFSRDSEAFDETVKRRLDVLRNQAEQVESLIAWINKADRLFGAKQRSSNDLARAIEEYQSFFARENLPHVDTSLCPTLERQYRECIATARQRVLLMEQTTKNWISYEQARQELRNWLQTAEDKLVEALRPGSATVAHSSSADLTSNGQVEQQDSSCPVKASPSRDDPVAQHMSRLDDLIDYFELEQVEMDDFDRLSGASLPSNSMHDELSYSSVSIDKTNNSLSGSLLSLGSTGSRMSTLASSKQANYNRLFDNFELKCRLLAAQLEPEQRDSLLMGVKELKSRLKYIIDHKVPQVVSEIRMSISRCEMSIKEQDELVDELEGEEEELERDTQSRAINGEEEEVDPNELADLDSGPFSSPEPLSEEHAVLLHGKKDISASATKESTTKASKRTSSKVRAKSRKSKRADSKNDNSVAKNLSKISAKSTATAVGGCAIDDDDECGPFYRSLWNKICRASKLSMSFSIVLLICLAGVCIVPLIQKDACCELSQGFVPSYRFTFNQRPV